MKTKHYLMIGGSFVAGILVTLAWQKWGPNAPKTSGYFNGTGYNRSK